MTNDYTSGSLMPMAGPSDNCVNFEPGQWTAGVSRELAAIRSQQISGLEYHLELGLNLELTRLSGLVRIKLELTSDPSKRLPIVLDFREVTADGQIVDGSIGLMMANGRVISDHLQANGHVIIPADHFESGENEIYLEFASLVSPVGRPLIRFDDLDTGEQIVYLLSVPMDASLAFPCFDQPDLKGRFSLSLDVPPGLVVIANSEAICSPSNRGALVRHRFAQTPPLSTYLFTFAVGPFAKLESVTCEPSSPVSQPLRLFVRQSQRSAAESQWPEILNLTSAGINHLNLNLGYAFPFKKYDQILLPGFPFRGMEHAGATFLREESVLFPLPPDKDQLLTRTALILHELVHQWFGDLVTMRWFDDLWIKEGFANLFAYNTMAAIQPHGISQREVWKRFHLAHRPGASAIDRTAGTTPIHQSVRNLIDAKSAYGAIVYQKAPIVLRYLSFMLGEEVFKVGVQRFLERHAFESCDWQDLIRAFETASGQQLETWAAAWIKESGLPCIGTEWELGTGVCCEGTQKLTIRLTQQDRQGAERHWPVTTLVRVVLTDGSTLSRRTSFDGPAAHPIELNVKSRPRFILANDSDWSYGSFPPDSQSLHALIEEVDATSDPLDRILLRGAIDDAFAEGIITPVGYFGILQHSIGLENDYDQLNWLLERLIQVTERYVESGKQDDQLSRTEKLLLSRMESGQTLGERLLLLRAFRRLAVSSASTCLLKSMLADDGGPVGQRLPSAERWGILTRLIALADPDSEHLYQAELEQDRSESCAKMAWIAAAARPFPETKDLYFWEYLHPSHIAEDWVEASLTAFNSRCQSELTIKFLRPALSALPQLKHQRKIFFILAWLNAFIGGHSAADALPIVDDFLSANSCEPDLVSKILQVADGLRRPAGI